ncbi:MAG: TIGR00341 family protein, partial [Nitrospinaceae bacterium]
MKLIEVVTSSQNVKPVTSIAEQHDSEVNWVGPPDEMDRQLISILVSDENRQSVLDALQGLLGESSKILVQNLEAVLPRKQPKLTDD